MSFSKVLKALATAGAKTVIAGLSAGGTVGKITGKILASALGIDEDDHELNEKIIEASRTKEGQERIRNAELELAGRKAQLFTELELKKLEAQVLLQESSDDLDEVIFTESQKSYRTELGHKDPRVYLIRPWLVKAFFWLVVFMVATVAMGIVADWVERYKILVDCETEACFDYLLEKEPYYKDVARAWNEMTVLKSLAIAVVTWFGSRGVEKGISNFRGLSSTV